MNIHPKKILLASETYYGKWWKQLPSITLGGGCIDYFALVLLLKAIHNICYRAFPKLLVFADKFRFIRWLRINVFLPTTFSIMHADSKRYTFAIPVRSHPVHYRFHNCELQSISKTERVLCPVLSALGLES